MRIRDALLSARNYLTVFIGFLLGFAIVVWVEKQTPAHVESNGGVTLSWDFPPLPIPRKLAFDETIRARVAWQYYMNNTQPNGLANAHDDEPWLSLQNVGGCLFTVVAAEQLYIVATAGGDERIAATPSTLGQLPLNARRLPTARYRADTLQILDNPDSSAINMERLLTALRTLLQCYPQHAAAVRGLFNQWRVDALVNNSPTGQATAPLHYWALAADKPRDSFGYRLYASHTLRPIGNTTGLAMTNPPQGQQMIDIDGIAMPNEGLRMPWGRQPSLISLPYLLTGSELGLDAQSAEIAWRIIQIQ